MKLHLSQHLTFLVVILVLGTMALFAILSVKDDSSTPDEFRHIVAGYSYLTQQDYRLNPEHPPLVKDLAAFPLLFLDLNFPLEHPAWTDEVNGQWNLGKAFFYQSGNNPDQILFFSRLPMIVLLVFLGWFLFFWTRKLGGNMVALGVLLLFSFSPTFLAHGRLVTTDVAAALGVVVATYFYLKFLVSPSLQRALLAALFLAVALLFKFSTFILIPYFFVLTFLYLLTKPEGIRESSLLKYVLYGIGIGLVTLIGIALVYQFHVWNYPPERQLQDSQTIFRTYYGVDSEDVSFEIAQHPLFRSSAHYFLGLLRSAARSQTGGVAYFLGEIGPTGWWYYFPVLYLFKVPLAFHILSIIAFASLFSFSKAFVLQTASVKRWIHQHFTEISMGIFIVLYAMTAVTSSLNIGIRHILPIFPFLYVLVALGVKKWFERIPFPSLSVKVVMLLLLGGWYIGSSISVFPYYLSYYNELAGGTANGYRVAVDSNYDWGQGLKRLEQWVETNNIELIYVDYFGGGDLAYYLGERYLPWYGSSLWDLDALGLEGKKFPRGNYLAVSASFLQGGGWRREPPYVRDYQWLDAHEPVGRAGYSFFIYYIE